MNARNTSEFKPLCCNRSAIIKKRFFSSQAFLFFLLLILIWVGLVCVKTTYKAQQMASDAGNLTARSEKLKEEIRKLSDEKSLLGNPSYLEKEAKLRLNLKKEGEEVVILSRENNYASVALGQISEDGQVVDSAPTTSEEKIEEEKNWRKWWGYFFDN